MNINVGVSARHVHVTEETVGKLFGDNYKLTKVKELSQPGQYACQETVTIQTEKGSIENVRILGPFRPYDQVELSRTDAFKLGINPPVRDSGNMEDSAPITLIGPVGSVALVHACIIAVRHIHLTKEEANKYDLHMEKVSVKVSGDKGGILHNVHLKVSDEYAFELHLDTDDANAHLLSQGDTVEIMKGQ